VVKRERRRRAATQGPELIEKWLDECVAAAAREDPAPRSDTGTFRTAVILCLRDKYACTWAQIGEALGITGERARQLHRQEARARTRDNFARAFLVRRKDATTESLTNEQKRRIIRRFYDLLLAIGTGSPTGERYEAFRVAYRGDSRAFVDAFDQCHTDRDREQWVNRLAVYLQDEIEPRFWHELNDDPNGR